MAKAPPSTTSQSTSDKSQSMKAEGMEDAEEDALDAYMASMNQQLEHDKVCVCVCGGGDEYVGVGVGGGRE